MIGLYILMILKMKRAFKISLLIPILLILLYGFFALIGSFVFVGSETEGEYPVYISSGTIHTEFVFDLHNSPITWSEFIPFETINPSLQSARYISIGWGDKRFFYELLEWSDLTFDLAFSSVFLPGESAVHVEYANELNSSLKHYKIQIDEAAYLKLFEFIKNSFVLESGIPIKIDEFSYYQNDRFFVGVGSYHLFNTCNIWTSRGLESIDAKRPLWSPFKYGFETFYR